MPQDMVERVTFETSFEEFVDKMRELQDDYREAVNGTGSRTVADVLSDYEGTQVIPKSYMSQFGQQMLALNNGTALCILRLAAHRSYQSGLQGLTADLARVTLS